jgi:AbrB family looped-hinge helix DNA binding protein
MNTGRGINQRGREMVTATLRRNGQVTIPQEIRQAAHLDEGDQVAVEIVADGILLRPLKLIDPSQAWFWSPEWQAGEREASADIAAGRTRHFATTEEFLAALDTNQLDADL